MEKLVYALWRGDRPEATWSTDLVGRVARDLTQTGVRWLKIEVVDDDVDPGAALRIGSSPQPKDAIVSFWLEESHRRSDQEAILAAAADRIAGYLVSESRPLRTPSSMRHTGGRTDGFHLVTCLRRRDDLTHEQFIDAWHGPFREVAIDGQNTFDYVRNEIVRPLTPDAPDWSAIVEEGFPAAALTDPAVFFDAVGDPERLTKQQTMMFEAVMEFLDLGSVESHPMSEYLFEPRPD